MWQSKIGVFAVSWPDQCEEWTVHLARVLTGGDRLGGEGNPAEREVILHMPQERERGSLRIRPDNNGISCVLFAEHEVAESDVQRWRDAAAEAAEQIGRHDQDFAWQAILGPHPGSPEWVRPSPLAKSEVVGPVMLVPGGVQMREFSGLARARIDSSGMFRYSWPVVASGVVRTYSPFAAEYQARRDAYRVCALLTLSRGTYWLARGGPRVLAPGHGGPLESPQSVGPWDSTPWSDGVLTDDFNVYKGGEHIVIPPWMLTAWEVLDEDDNLKQAVHASYEAISLEIGHPSAAFLLYVAAIEGIGARLVELTRCKNCGSQVGARRRFREALKTVMSPDEVKTLAGIAYGARSKTGHEGQLHGAEHAFGHGDFSLFDFDDADYFDFALIRPIRKACRQLLVNIFKERQSAIECVVS